MQTLTLTPLMRHAVGFDRFNDILDSIVNKPAETQAYPPYNIEKTGENTYRITMAVAGFRPEELEVLSEEDEVTISGKSRDEEKSEAGSFLYKGIATRSFKRTFRLADYVRVAGASVGHGLLQVELEREVPEARKPRLIEIKTGQTMDNKVIKSSKKS